jgi:hypothetical protein
MKLRLFCISILAVTVLAVPAAFAEDPVALVAEGGTADGLLVESINNPAVNHSGGWAFNLNVNDGAATLGAFWGNASGGPGGLIRTEGTFPPYEQVSYESFWGFGAGGLACYSAISNHIDDGTTSLDGVWLDDSPVAVEEMVFPHLPDYWWSFGSRPGVTEDGIPYFVGGITETQGGSTATRGLFYGLDASPLILGGDVLPGLPAPISTGSSVAFDFRFSAYGTHYIAEVTMDTGSTTDNTALVFDGEGLFIGGLLVQEGKAVPASAGGLPEENWSAFDYCGVSESGSYMFTGDTNAATTEDEFVVIDGVIVLREGMMIGDLTLSGSIEGAFMNEDGDYAVIWDVNLPTGENVEALIFNGDVVLLEGDIIDTDGDGVPQPDCTLDNFTGISSLVLADRADNNSVALYFTADVLVPDGAAANPAGQVVRPDDTAGIDEEYTVEGDTRALLEYGYGLTFGGVVPTLLSEFDCQIINTGVQISWRVSGGSEADRLALIARSGDRTWEVPFDSAPGGRFTALDQAASGGEVIYSLMITGTDGEARLLGEQAVRLETPAAGITLQGAYPNPFNPETKITFRVGTAQQVQLAVYDLSGRLVTVLANEMFTEGVHQVSWNGRDQNGAAVPSGTYFARTTGDQGVQTAKLMLVK